MYLKMISILLLISPSVLAKESKFNLRVGQKSYRISIIEGSSVSFKEKTINLIIKNKPCHKIGFEEFEELVSKKLNIYQAYTKRKAIDSIKCNRSPKEKEICKYLNALPYYFQRTLINQKLSCSKKSKEN